jgi:hypothetical protein
MLPQEAAPIGLTPIITLVLIQVRQVTTSTIHRPQVVVVPVGSSIRVAPLTPSLEINISIITIATCLAIREGSVLIHQTQLIKHRIRDPLTVHLKVQKLMPPGAEII